MPTLVSNTIKPTSGDTVTFANCNVSVGGTVTHEDVTNIDSVGLITARSGINATGIVTSITGAAVTYYGDGSNLTGVEAGVKNFVASGTIDNGKTVVLNTDGTVGIVTQTTGISTVSDLIPFTPTSNGSSKVSSVYDTSTNKIVIVWRDGSYDLNAIVGTVDSSNNSISFGSTVLFAACSYELNLSATFDNTNNRVVVSYAEAAGGSGTIGLTAMVGQVIGTGITFGTAVTINNTLMQEISSTYDTANNRVVIFSVPHSQYNASAVVGTVNSGNNSISVGSSFIYKADRSEMISATYDSAKEKVVLAYKNSDALMGAAIVGTVDSSNNSISYGSEVIFDYANSWFIGATYDSANERVVFVYSRDSSDGTAIVGEVVGTAITFGSSAQYSNYSGNWNVPVYDSTNNKVVIAYTDYDNSYLGYLRVSTVDPTDNSIGLGNSFIFSGTSQSYYHSCAYDTNSDRVVIVTGLDSTNTGVVSIFATEPKVTNLTAENYIGIAGEAIANAATGKVNVLGGVNSGQSGLTTAKTYYVGQTGILTTTADTPSVVAGTSISDTKILVR